MTDRHEATPPLRPLWYRAAKSVRDSVRGAYRSARRNIGLRTQILANPWYAHDLRAYREMGGEAPFADLYPRLTDKTAQTGVDYHYFYQAAWAANCLRTQNPAQHPDVGSSSDFVGMMTAFVPVHFIDIRPLPVELPGLTNVAGTILELPFGDRTIDSLSCMHVAEHIGLGRYGDPLDPLGTVKATKELQRVVAADGHLYFSLPVGAPRTQFNAHRVLSIRGILEAFDGLDLVSFSITDDDGVYHEDVSPDGWDDQIYACGMFHFCRTV